MDQDDEANERQKGFLAMMGQMSNQMRNFATFMQDTNKVNVEKVATEKEEREEKEEKDKEEKEKKEEREAEKERRHEEREAEKERRYEEREAVNGLGGKSTISFAEIYNIQ